MQDIHAPTPGKFTLPLVSPAQPADWHGWQPLQAIDAPEPVEPQGIYAEQPEPDSVTMPAAVASGHAELLAPAGGPDAAFAAFHFGADAIYLGLKKFSARAEAENFTLAEVGEVTAYAHSLQPRRRVFVTINTLIRQDELAELVEVIAQLADLGVDALIIQDLGVYHLVRQHFPNLELHASTQLSVHNRAGAAMLHRLGFHRVVLARELTFEEVRDITAAEGIETEVFIHGALCYSYSGLCLFSSQTLGRSGNRGKCAYSCRDSFDVQGAPLTLRDGSAVRRDPAQGFPFSMKDLALPDHVPALRSAGVSCFKIEGRKKSPLYVATTTDYYRKLIDGTLTAEDRPMHEAEMQTVFSRPWTRLFVQSHKDKEVADRDTVGHRGTPVGKVEAIHGSGVDVRLRFRTGRELQRHDGLQIDLPVLGKPFGFPVDRLWTVSGKRQEVFEAPAGSVVEVGLPREHPAIPIGAPVYCSSSQAVKQKYQHDRPKPEQYRVRQPVEIDAVLSAAALVVTGRVADDRPLPRYSGGEGRGEGVGMLCSNSPPHPRPLFSGVRGSWGEGSQIGAPHRVRVEVQRSLPGPFAPARDSAAMESAARATFEKLGASSLELARFSWKNEANGFVPVSRLNQLRRDLVTALEEAWQRQQADEIARLQAEMCPTPAAVKGRASRNQHSLSPVLGGEGRGEGVGIPCSDSRPLTPDPSPPEYRGRGKKSFAFRWSIKVDRIGYLDALEAEDIDGIDEIIIDIARDHPTLLQEKLERWAGRIGRERLRLALPALSRAWEEKGLQHKIAALQSAGWRKWEAANLSAWDHLGLDPLNPDPAIDLASDWSLYVINRLAALQLLSMGVGRFALSPEDGMANVRSLLAEFSDRAVLIVYQDTPLFLAESCAYANLIGGCPGKANCKFESMEMTSSHGERVTALDYHCRTIVLNQGPFSLASRLKELAKAGATHLRADFIYRPYEPDEVRHRWRLIRAGKSLPQEHSGNFDRGIL